MHLYEVTHPDSDRPHPTFNTWAEALAAQKEWNKEVSGHKARKIQPSEIPVDIECVNCKGVFIGWPHQKGDECFDCFAAREGI